MEISEIKKKALSLPKLIVAILPIYVSSLLFIINPSIQTFGLWWIIIAYYLLIPIVFPKECTSLYYLNLLFVRYQEGFLPPKLLEVQYNLIGYDPQKPDESEMIKFHQKQFLILLLFWCLFLVSMILKILMSR